MMVDVTIDGVDIVTVDIHCGATCINSGGGRRILCVRPTMFIMSARTAIIVLLKLRYPFHLDTGGWPEDEKRFP